MSIYHPLSYHVRSTEMPLAAGATLTADGQALVGSMVNGVFGVGPSTGAGGEKFVGFLTAQVSAAPFQEQTSVKVETVTVNGGGVATLAFTPLAGTVLVYSVTAGAVVAGPYTIVGKTITGLTAAAVVTITYSYALTVSQSVAMLGNVQPSGYAGLYISQAGVAQEGRIYTNQFDSAANWAAATGVKLAAGGKVTDQAGAGVAINAIIVQIPSVDFPFLGLEYSAL